MPGKAKSLNAGAMHVKGGKSGGMHKMTPVGTQKPGVSSVSGTNGGGKFAKGGGSGKMNKMTPVQAAKAGKTSVR